MCRDFDAANKILPSIPRDQYDSVARFLDSQGFREEALVVAQDPDMRFDLALQLDKLEVRKRAVAAALDASPTVRYRRPLS